MSILSISLAIPPPYPLTMSSAKDSMKENAIHALAYKEG
jgi:hypothetical protein